jgi:quercetin dioxygenase-like cupin family protein
MNISSDIVGETMNTDVVITNIEDTKARHNVALLGSETNQQFSLRVQEVSCGDGTPLHIHTDQAETFHVVSGSFRFRVGDDEIIGHPGFTVHIPKGIAHCFLYEAQHKKGQLISILTPGINDGFIQALPEAQKENASQDELAAIAGQFGTKIIGLALTPSV